MAWVTSLQGPINCIYDHKRTVCREKTFNHCVIAGLPPPAPRQPVPRVITFQRKRANRRVINEEGLLELLSEFGQVGAHAPCLPESSQQQYITRACLCRLHEQWDGLHGR